MAAVPTGVRERMDRAVAVPGQQDAPEASALSSLVAGVRQLVAATDAQPAAAEKVLSFPLEHGFVDIGGAGEHPALTERQQ